MSRNSSTESVFHLSIARVSIIWKQKLVKSKFFYGTSGAGAKTAPNVNEANILPGIYNNLRKDRRKVRSEAISDEDENVMSTVHCKGLIILISIRYSNRLYPQRKCHFCIVLIYSYKNVAAI